MQVLPIDKLYLSLQIEYDSKPSKNEIKNIDSSLFCDAYGISLFDFTS